MGSPPLPGILAATLLASGAAATTQQQWLPVDGPHAAGRGVAYDIARDRQVAFGTEGRIWEYDGGIALPQACPNGPAPRHGATVVHDPVRGHTLLFGGRITTPFADTWLWADGRWRQGPASPAPSPRFDAGATFDSRRGRVVLWGGQLGGNVASDTWEHDGVDWLWRPTATVPTPVNAPVLAFDSFRGVVVMVVSPGMLGQPLQVWEYDGIDWTARGTGAGAAPVHRSNHNIAYDPLRRRIVMFGGSENGGELWEWDGGGWQLMTTVTAPRLLNPAMHFDPQRGHVVIVGGQDRSSGSWTTAAWGWDGASLQPLWPAHRPMPRYGFSVAHDFGRNRVVVFGGYAFGPRDDTWEWDGTTWSNPQPAVSPPVREDAAFAFDPFRGSTVLFGGFATGVYRGDTWQWDGSSWTQMSGPGPSPRGEAGMALDWTTNRTILFGGYQNGSWLGDTWSWDGTAWTQLQPANAPSGRIRQAMAADPSLGRLVLFGGARLGFTAANYLNDTWEWDGNNWQRIQTPTTPGALLGASMAYDWAGARLLLVGNELATGTLQTWEYRNRDWVLLASQADPLLGSAISFFDLSRSRLGLFDGNGLFEWSDAEGTVDGFGAGCGAPPPRLLCRTRPRLGTAEFGLEVFAEPQRAALFGLGWGQGSVPLGSGCTLLVQPVAATAFVVTDGRGIALQRIPLPPSSGLRGLVLWAQAAVLAPLRPAGLEASRGLRIRLGD